MHTTPKLAMMALATFGLAVAAPAAVAQQYNSGTTYESDADKTMKKDSMAKETVMEKESMMETDAMMKKKMMTDDSAAIEPAAIEPDVLVSKDDMMAKDGVTKDGMMDTSRPVSAAPSVAVNAAPLQADCPAGTTLQPDNTCLQN